MRLRTRLLFVVAASPLLFLRATEATAPKPSAAAAPTDGKSAELIGPASCASRGCHGSTTTTDSESRKSFQTWIRDDKHTQAYAVLLAERGKSIYRKYEKDETKFAHSDARCLACHTTPALASAGVSESLASDRVFGVGCEACHGAAKDWKGPHTGWGKTTSDAVRKENGMTPLGGPAERAAMCAGCHIGAPADLKRGVPTRDMNHDMIAAGHPRLMFEFGAFQANMPRHWDEKDKSPDFEAKAWTAGQAASATVALELLADRAKRGKEDKAPWPEFAESDCYACHHGLGGGLRPVNAKPGVPALSDWYYKLEFASETVRLRELMSASFRPNPEKVAQVAGLLAGSLSAKSNAAPLKMVKSLAAKTPASWDEVEQIFLGLQAARVAAKAANAPLPAEALKAIEALGTAVTDTSFKDADQRPKDWDGDATRKAVEDALEKLKAAVK